MKILFLFLLTLCFSTLTWAQGDFETEKITILSASELTITGDTNISKFKCGFDSVLLGRNVGINFIETGSGIKMQNAVLKLDNKGFNCGSKAINKDFNTLLETEEYPEITLEINSLDFLKDFRTTALVTITIAGISKDYSVTVASTRDPESSFTGKLKLNIKDFRLEPPKKAFGLIVIKEEISINFSLRFETPESSIAESK